MVLLRVPRSREIAAAGGKEVERLWAELDEQNLRPEVVHGQLVLKPMPTKNPNKAVERLMEQLFPIEKRNSWVFYTNWYIHIPPVRGDRRAPDLIIGSENPPLYDGDQNQVHGTQAYHYKDEAQVKAGEPLELPEPFGITLDTAALFPLTPGGR